MTDEESERRKQIRLEILKIALTNSYNSKLTSIDDVATGLQIDSSTATTELSHLSDNDYLKHSIRSGEPRWQIKGKVRDIIEKNPKTYDEFVSNLQVKDDVYEIVEAGPSARPPGLAERELRQHETESIPQDIPPTREPTERMPSGGMNTDRKIFLKIIGIVAALIIGGTAISISIDVNSDDAMIIDSPGAEINQGDVTISNSPGAVVNQGDGAVVNQDNSISIENFIENQQIQNPNIGIPDDTIFQIYRETEPYSIDWTNCGQLSKHTNIYDETIGWTISFTPVLLDKNGKQSDVPFNTIFTFDMLGYVESSARPIEYDPIKYGPHIVNPKSNSSFELDLTDTFESAKQDDVDWVEIKLVKEKSVLYLPNAKDNFGDFISNELDLTMTSIGHIKEPVEWAKMDIGEYKCNDLFEIK